MRTYDEITADLRQPLSPELIAIRPNDKKRYLEGWNAINQANRIFGYDRWGTEVLGVEYKELTRTSGKPAGLYAATVRVTVTGWATKTDVGIGITAGDSPDAHETAYKGAVTDAMKRALRQFGPQFGNELYDHDAPTVAEQQPQEQKIAQTPMALWQIFLNRLDDGKRQHWINQVLQRSGGVPFEDLTEGEQKDTLKWLRSFTVTSASAKTPAA